MRLLLVYYHPIVFDLAESFQRVCDKVSIAVNLSIKDNYGIGADVIKRIKNNKYLNDVNAISLQEALQKIKNKEYDLVGCDGVFNGDALIMDLCNRINVPWFCINGYPHNLDEPAQNILSFSHFLPQMQYKQKYPSEGHIKQFDWEIIANEGQNQEKNIFVYYPEMNEVKRFLDNVTWKGHQLPTKTDDLVSFIHRFEECNKWSYKLFQKLQTELYSNSYRLKNYSNLPQSEVYNKMRTSFGLVHLKHGDCPGISVLEALILERPVITMRSFVNASFNQEVLIDNSNAVISDTFDELIERTIDLVKGSQNHKFDFTNIWTLTSFERQKNKLERFFNKCLN